ncbi:hypothetical protein GALMADRAFT_863877 [Galerina marginata CBS 339.88]|uniref:Uncharacterized protein n=1 Tax=Galerina marginata (strain CBS 339.88) TaxID=685588 RepID=A0A067TVK5_GALM3|nr:hypothetical protein GALMADRAFT_863877 [Galerina marginata CBS 339.88]
MDAHMTPQLYWICARMPSLSWNGHQSINFLHPDEFRVRRKRFRRYLFLFFVFFVIQDRLSKCNVRTLKVPFVAPECAASEFLPPSPSHTMLVISDEDSRQAREFATISSILSLCSYSMVLLLFVSSLWLLLRAPPDPSKTMRRFLLFFLVSMFSVSTLATVSALVLNFAYPIASFLSFSTPSTNQNLCTVCNCGRIRILENCCVTLVIWAADGFMIWRCTVLYNGIAAIRRLVLLVFCFILGILSFGE